MADSEAVRSRRKRLHAAGDHSMCRRCAVVAPKRPALAPVDRLPSPAPSLLDPAAEMRALAARLVAEHVAEPSNMIAARELRMTLAALMPKDAGNADADLTGLLKALG